MANTQRLTFSVWYPEFNGCLEGAHKVIAEHKNAECRMRPELIYPSAISSGPWRSGPAAVSRVFRAEKGPRRFISAIARFQAPSQSGRDASTFPAPRLRQMDGQTWPGGGFPSAVAS